MKNELETRPILPRNLSARAAELVAGNPMSARPESGVGNTHPGLEIDLRALDRRFLPPLVIDFHYGAGARLAAIDGGAIPLSTGDIAAGLFIWAIRGNFGDQPKVPRTVDVGGMDGYKVLRRVMDLEPGPVAVAIGPWHEAGPAPDARTAALAALANGRTVVQRDGDRVTWAVVAGKRADFLTSDGVIDPALLPPGELTQSLCSPWQWDFADCHCYYWASSKPDIVIGDTGQMQTLNFQRDRYSPEPPAPSRDHAGWVTNVMNQPDILRQWEELPVVTGDKENAVPRRPVWPSIAAGEVLSREEIVRQLTHVATIEHALCVEYLFARLSISAPRLPVATRDTKHRLRSAAAGEILAVAVDEMRHLRWVNEALVALGEPVSLGRADVIRQDLGQSFELRPLSPKVLDEFIAIEAPSAVLGDDAAQLDGIYTRMLVSLAHPANPLTDVLSKRLSKLIKLIVDEGVNHYERFQRIKRKLREQKPDDYLRPLRPGEHAPEGSALMLQEFCDHAYHLVLAAIRNALEAPRRERGHWLRTSHLAMDVLDQASFALAELGYGPLFTLPPGLSNLPAPAHFLDSAMGGAKKIAMASERSIAEVGKAMQMQFAAMQMAYSAKAKAAAGER